MIVLIHETKFLLKYYCGIDERLRKISHAGF
jgi:hypothetical protein